MNSKRDETTPTADPSQVKTKTKTETENETMTEPDVSSSVPMRKRTVTAVSWSTSYIVHGVYKVR
jgi:hypothetical protein